MKLGKKINLNKWLTRVKPVYNSKKDYHKFLRQHVEELSKRQNLLYAPDHYALLLIFRAMDAPGKEGTIKRVMSGVNPAARFSFKHPSAQELDHDFLWRTTRCVPERGRIGIFNRSYYEEVLIVRMHPEILHAQEFGELKMSYRKLDKTQRKELQSIRKQLSVTNGEK